MESPFNRILRYTKNNISRNKWLSLATILVSTIIFTTASIFIASSLIARQAVKVAETKAQLTIYFETDAPESEISLVKSELSKLDGVKNINYISQEEALAIYLGQTSDNGEVANSSISKEWLPASLEIQANSLEELETITKDIKERERINPYIDDVQYREDVIDQLKAISRYINIGGIIVITIFASITFALIIITISFNIMAHKSEIEIMHLVGSKDKDISLPFILEGVIYTVTGVIISTLIILVPWYLFMAYGSDANAYFILKEILRSLDLGYLITPNALFIAIYVGIHLLVATVVGLIGSGFAVKRYLSFKEN